MRRTLPATSAVVLLGGCANSATDATSQSLATSTEYPPISQSEAISMTLAGFPQQDFSSLTVVASSEKDSVAPLWMHATMNVDSRSSGTKTKGLWEACLADGAIAEHLAGDATDLEQVIVGVHIHAQFPDGSTEEEGGCGGTSKPGAVYTAQAQNLSDAEIVDDVDEVLERYGLTPVDVDVLHPLGPAVSVVASVPDVDSVEGQFAGIEDAILGDPYRYDGINLELQGQDGTPLTGAWTALRAGSGGYWFRPGMDGALGIGHG